MRGYSLLGRIQYAAIYALTAVALLLNLVGTVLGLWQFGGPIWYPALLLLFVVFLLEVHSAYQRNLA